MAASKALMMAIATPSAETRMVLKISVAIPTRSGVTTLTANASISPLDRLVDVIGDGFDAAVRTRPLADSGLKRRQLGTFRRILAGQSRSVSKTPGIH
ncbi:hypothetical protein [Pectobacterium versatile]|uniref:hypothetical protein n=1 Tax=Pectobacterium versatile TaxID=2488639 RepID=UPI001CD152AE|nr:hypothetical protein [Pectobacterium versatile]